MDDTFTELDKKVGQLYKKALYPWLDVKETTLPSSWCPLYSAKHVRLGRSKDEYNRSNVNKVDDQIKEAFSAYFSGRSCALSYLLKYTNFITETKHTPFGGSLQANCSIDPKCLVYYYEVKINKLKSGAVISVGFGEEWSENYKEKGRSSKLPGELWNTFGWLSNGDLLCSGEKVGSMQGYGVNDIVGIGLNFVENNIFCTKKVNKNDYFVVAYRGWQVKEFLVVPKVGFRKNAEIRANFGQNHFEYHEKLKELIERLSGQPTATELLKAQPEEVLSQATVESNLLTRLKRLFPYLKGETLPSRWSHRHKRYNLELSMNGLEVTCKTICPTFNCAGSVRSDVPIPPGFPFYYFEMEILESNSENSVAIGICTDKVHLGHMPGRFFYSYGYHSDGSASGPELREGKDKEQQIYRYPDWQPKFKKGDVIGCGLNLADIDAKRDRSELFFTVNGRYLGFAYYYLADENWYPMIAATKSKSSFAKGTTSNTDNKKITTIPIAKPTIVLPCQSIDSDNSCARIRPFVGKQPRVKSLKSVAAEPSTSTTTNQQLHSTPKALSSKPMVPKPKKSLVPKPSALRDPRLFSPNPVPTTPDKKGYTPITCLDQPCTSSTNTPSTSSNPLLRDPACAVLMLIE
uniref:B30.2/SPRY domain-containing protein n=1 Tax=Ditylenchus dipsaci TaxID=166011 RepID=A0A915DMH2_9BILA